MFLRGDMRALPALPHLLPLRARTFAFALYAALLLPFPLPLFKKAATAW